jgi:hypothetical protein
VAQDKGPFTIHFKKPEEDAAEVSKKDIKKQRAHLETYM